MASMKSEGFKRNERKIAISEFSNSPATNISLFQLISHVYIFIWWITLTGLFKVYQYLVTFHMQKTRERRIQVTKWDLNVELWTHQWNLWQIMNAALTILTLLNSPHFPSLMALNLQFPLARMLFPRYLHRSFLKCLIRESLPDTLHQIHKTVSPIFVLFYLLASCHHWPGSYFY